MKTNVSRKTINTYIYLKKPCNKWSADKQVHMMKASNNKNLFKSYCGFYACFWFIEMKGLEMVKWKSLRINMFRITHTGKSVNFPVTILMLSKVQKNVTGIWSNEILTMKNLFLVPYVFNVEIFMKNALLWKWRYRRF